MRNHDTWIVSGENAAALADIQVSNMRRRSSRMRHRDDAETDTEPVQPRFKLSAGPQSELRARITAAHREDEKAAVQRLLTQAQMPPDVAAAVEGTARRLVARVRARRSESGGVDALM